MKQLVTKEIKFDSLQSQVQFQMNREFSRIPQHLILNEDFFNEVTYLTPSEEYLEMQALTRGISMDELQDEIFEDYTINGDLYLCDDYYIDNGSVCNPDILYDLGIVAFEYKDEYFLCPIGYGYDTTEKFGKLFEYLGFINYEEIDEK